MPAVLAQHQRYRYIPHPYPFLLRAPALVLVCSVLKPCLFQPSTYNAIILRLSAGLMRRWWKSQWRTMTWS